jgi:hypothetical protein
MQYLPRWAALLLVVGLVVPLLAADEKPADPKKDPDKNAVKGDDKKPDPKPDDKKPDPKKTPEKSPPAAKPSPGKVDLSKDLDKNVNSEKTIKAGHLTGKVLAIIESKKSLRLQVTLQVPKLNAGALNGLQQAQVNLQVAMARNDVGGVINARNSIAQHQANLYHFQTVTKEVELQTTDDVKVRLAYPPAQFDDKGKPKKYTAKELKELKGPDPRLPGYNGEFSDLQQEQTVTVTLVKKKDAPRPAAKPKGKEADVDLLQGHLPQVSLILVVFDPNANTGK